MKPVPLTPEEAARFLSHILRSHRYKPKPQIHYKTVVTYFEEYWAGSITKRELVKKCGYDDHERMPEYLDRFVNLKEGQ